MARKRRLLLLALASRAAVCAKGWGSAGPCGKACAKDGSEVMHEAFADPHDVSMEEGLRMELLQVGMAHSDFGNFLQLHAGVDEGSCGNACCVLDAPTDMMPEAIKDRLVDFLQSGGSREDGHFSYVPGQMPFDEHPADDLRDSGNEWQFIVQGRFSKYETQEVYTLDFNVRLGEAAPSVLRAFSISGAPGAFEDLGALDRLLLSDVLEAVGVPSAQAQALYGCGTAPAPAQAEVATALGAPALDAGGSTCGLAEGAAECDHPDTGSCGNACCTLEVNVEATPERVYATLLQFLDSGGDNASYAHVPGDEQIDDNLEDDAGSEAESGFWKFIVQGKHFTSGRHYVDTLNFNVGGKEHGPSVLRLFSISDLHGALGDSGQNYKNLAFLLSGLGIEGIESGAAEMLYGCGLAS